MQESWFQELIRMQVRQDYISFRESSLLSEGSAVPLSAAPLQRRAAGRPRKLTRAIENTIVRLYEEAYYQSKEHIGKRLSFRELARRYGCNRMTVQRIIYRRGNKHMVEEIQKERKQHDPDFSRSELL